ncbi:MAG TPA: pentapeptide repeat-containing protein [Candidatus Aquilonibacter sp.]|nr:pentapeptide repeat-containing protein [Candidatus Aquilonibacter sp.]
MPHLDTFEPIARIGFAILLNGIWQGALIAFVTWLALYVFRRANAATRYAVWSLSLLAVLIVPVLTSLSRVSVEPQVTAVSSSTAISSQMHPGATKRIVIKQTAPSTTATAAPAAHSFVLPSLALRLPDAVAPAIVAAWFLAALVILVRLIVAFMQLERLKHDSLPLSVEYRDSMPRWMNAVKGSRDVRICTSEAIEVPIAVGLFDSMVLLPSHLVHSLDPGEIDQISLHELGHLLRADDWTNAIQRIASALLFFNPAVWFISRQMDVEREVACDDYVLQLTGSVRPYAFCLTKMAEMTAWPHRPMPAPGVFVTRKNISIRIERLLRTGRAIGSSIAPTVAGSFIASLVAVFIVLRLMTPSIAFTLPAPPAQPVAAIPKAPIVAIPTPHAVPSAHVVASPAPHHVSPPIPAIVPRSSTMTKELADASTMISRALATTKVAQVRVHQDGCTGCDFEGANLRGRDFSNRSMDGANFENANLESARFDRSRMSGANFANADLRNASFRNTELEGCNLRGAKLDGVNFDGAHMTGCSIDARTLTAPQARAVLASCEGCDFAGVDLRGMDLHGLILIGANLAHADLRNANLSGADLTGANLGGARLGGANLDHADLTGSNLHDADLRGVDLSHTNLTGAAMSGANWKN